MQMVRLAIMTLMVSMFGILKKGFEMHQTFVNINGKSFGFVNPKEAFVHLMSLAIHRAEYMDLSVIKENLCTACDLVSEMSTIKADELGVSKEPGKLSFRRLSTRMTDAKGFITNIYDKKRLLLIWGDMMMSVDEKPLLRGFGFGSKKHLDIEIGNAEKSSVIRSYK